MAVAPAQLIVAVAPEDLMMEEHAPAFEVENVVAAISVGFMVCGSGEDGLIVRRVAVVADGRFTVVVVDSRAGAIDEVAYIGQLDPQRAIGEIEALDDKRIIDHEVRTGLHEGNLAVGTPVRIDRITLPSNPPTSVCPSKTIVPILSASTMRSSPWPE